MSYADIAKKGPKQTDEEKMPHQVPEISHDDDVHSLDSTSSEHLSSVPSSSSGDQGLLSDDVKRETSENVEKLSKDAQEFGKKADSKRQELQKEGSEKASEWTEIGKEKASEWSEEASQWSEEGKEKASKWAEEGKQKASQLSEEGKKKASQLSEEAQKKAEQLKKEAGVEGRKAKEEAKKAEEWADKNKGNPVVIGNAVAIAALGGLLGIGAYRKHVAGELTWKLAGTWAGVVGLFAVGDYYVSQYFFRNKYPPK